MVPVLEMLVFSGRQGAVVVFPLLEHPLDKINKCGADSGDRSGGELLEEQENNARNEGGQSENHGSYPQIIGGPRLSGEGLIFTIQMVPVELQSFLNFFKPDLIPPEETAARDGRFGEESGRRRENTQYCHAWRFRLSVCARLLQKVFRILIVRLQREDLLGQ